MSMILTKTPVWVWAVLAGLIALGLFQARTRSVRRMVLLIPGVALGLYSLIGVMRGFPGHPEAIAAWCAGFVMTLLGLRAPLIAALAALRRAPLAQGVIEGSLVPLMLFLAIFGVNFALGVTRGMAPAMLEQSSVYLGISALLGGFAGILLGRGIKASLRLP
jgi:hypothetical protein